MTLYHATDKNIENIGEEKCTMFFTSDFWKAKSWGEEIYGDYSIVAVDITGFKVEDFKPITGREKYAVTDFEILENANHARSAEYWSNTDADIVHYEECNSGFIIRDIAKFRLYYTNSRVEVE